MFLERLPIDDSTWMFEHFIEIKDTRIFILVGIAIIILG